MTEQPVPKPEGRILSARAEQHLPISDIWFVIADLLSPAAVQVKLRSAAYMTIMMVADDRAHGRWRCGTFFGIGCSKRRFPTPSSFRFVIRS